MTGNENTSYTPAVGDHVMLPNAPSVWPAGRVYTVREVTDGLLGAGIIQLAHGDVTWTLPAEWPLEWGITRAYTAVQVNDALQRGTDLVDVIADAPILGTLHETTMALLGPKLSFTRGQFTQALNDAASRIEQEENPDGGESSDTIWTQDVLNLAVCATEHILDHPGADLRDVIEVAHKDTDLSASAEDDLPEGTVKGSEAWNDALYKTVTGWIS
jgi:hypothetical protein